MQRPDITSGLAGGNLETIAKASKRVRNHIIGNPYQKETLASALQQHALTILKNDELRTSSLGQVILADVVMIVASIADTSLKLQPAVFEAITELIEWIQSSMDCDTTEDDLRPNLLRATCSLAPGFNEKQTKTIIALFLNELNTVPDISLLGHTCAAIASLGRTLKEPISVTTESISSIFGSLNKASLRIQANIIPLLAVASRNHVTQKSIIDNAQLPSGEHFLDWVVSFSNFKGFQQRPFILIDAAEILISCSQSSPQHANTGITILTRLLDKKTLNKSHYERIVPILLRYLEESVPENFPGRSVAILGLIELIATVLINATKSLTISTKQDIFILITKAIPGVAKSKKKLRIPKVLISASCEELLHGTDLSLRLVAGHAALTLSRSNERVHFASYPLTELIQKEEANEELCLVVLKTLANVIIDSDKLTLDILKSKETLTEIVKQSLTHSNIKIRVAALHVIKNVAHFGSTTSDNKEIVTCFPIEDIVKLLGSTDEEIVFVTLGILRNLHHRVKLVISDEIVDWGQPEPIQCVVNGILPILANAKPQLRRQAFFVAANIATYAPGLTDKTLFSKVLQLTLKELESSNDDTDKVKVAAAW
eukprot:CAMPEP_0168517378 /NCGR_PEP_ID=MMETSP0405-20121227/6000_1 /TAXON_ID=498012 /ORGANISM="Trichosphaerium sp, Strain Am-I-7 wt" /LENGTH=601 /DNA_ID=CAMNT_0008537345 /DNA_START=53 /DNA_END=1855 /DNA_ORIENTATION=-